MVKERNGLLGRLRDTLRPQVVGAEQEYVRHTAEEREEILSRLFGGAVQEQPEEEDADGPVGREATP
jgi:hypothetical protein